MRGSLFPTYPVPSSVSSFLRQTKAVLDCKESGKKNVRVVQVELHKLSGKEREQGGLNIWGSDN